MHVPTKESCKIDILTFENALKSQADRNNYDKSKWIYIPDFYCDYRYILGTVGRHPLITIGINPSTAKPESLDRTLQFVSRISENNSFDSFVMFNVYAQRATKPVDMDREFNPKLHEENMIAFRWLLKQINEPPVIWAAWGNIINQRDYLKKCLIDMVNIGKEYNAVWKTTGKPTNQGNPHHPLYLSRNSVLRRFDIDDYLNKII